MGITRKTFIEFFYPGAFFTESSVREVKDRDYSKIRIPRTAFGFRFFDVIFAKVTVDGELVELESKSINVSPVHYYGGRVYTRKEVAKKFPDKDILLANMRGNRMSKVVRTRLGTFQEFCKGDVLLRAGKR